MSTAAIIGGGNGGITLAKALDEHLDVVLIEPKDAFVHSVAALRGPVDQEWSSRSFFDYATLLTRGRVLRDRAVKADATGVSTAAGTRIDADYIVLATGSTYPYPAKYDLDDSTAVLAKLTTTHQALHETGSPVQDPGSGENSLPRQVPSRTLLTGYSPS
ncbi:FAD-dependent oxidoreductase [Nonomuraea sp. MTCD27]|uniref:FAD-dependent oxidoreductase n=1 Tax=Nonomuraea sp. MTCD27 TaxID=1676747 RepID=UPI0035C1AE02